jgi:uroporphyrinogen decarboxylase
MAIISDFVLSSPKRLAMPVLTFPGGHLVGASVQEMATDMNKQVAAQLALYDQFQMPFAMSAMDLSVEAEEFGSDITFSETEVPTVNGRLVTHMEAVEDLRIPVVGTKRTRVYLETVHQLARHHGMQMTLGGMIGPFSLAGRLFGVSEILAETVGDPELVLALLHKTTGFLVAYARAFKEAGAKGVIIAEPTAGLMSPSSALLFSSPFIKRIIQTVEDDQFQVILHNCGARIAHLDAKLQSDAKILHFGKPMDLHTAITRIPSDVVICGNLDPSEIFVGYSAEELRVHTRQLLEHMKPYKNFVISSGCDIPAHTPMENITAFFETVSSF